MLGSMKAPLLFDVDGTIFASGELVMECYQQTLDELGVPRLAPDALRKVVGPPLDVSFSEIVGLPAADIPEAIRLYRARYLPRFLEPPLYEGVPELLRGLKAAGVPLATATTKLESWATEQLTYWGLEDCFVFIAGATPESGPSKSAVVARAVDHLQRAGFATDGTVLIGDRSHDVEGAAANGLEVIGAGWGYGTPAEFLAPNVRGVAESPAQLGEWLGLPSR